MQKENQNLHKKLNSLSESEKLGQLDQRESRDREIQLPSRENALPATSPGDPHIRRATSAEMLYRQPKATGTKPTVHRPQSAGSTIPVLSESQKVCNGISKSTDHVELTYHPNPLQGFLFKNRKTSHPQRDGMPQHSQGADIHCPGSIDGDSKVDKQINGDTRHTSVDREEYKQLVVELEQLRQKLSEYEWNKDRLQSTGTQADSETAKDYGKGEEEEGMDSLHIPRLATNSQLLAIIKVGERFVTISDSSGM